MSLPYKRLPNLQVRDARAASDHSELEELRLFFNSTLPPDGPLSRAPNASIGKSNSGKKSGVKKNLFSMRKKRPSSDWGELGSFEETPRPTPIPPGTTQRRLGDHTVIMIGSRQPPRPILSDLRKSPPITGTSSPKPSHKSLQHVFSPLLMSPQQDLSSPVLLAQQSSMHLSPPPAILDRVARPPMIKSSSTTDIQNNSSRPPLQSSMSHTGLIIRLGQDRPDIASVASDTEIFVTAHNSPVMEPPPIYVQSPFVSHDSTTMSATASMTQDRREVSHFSIDSDDASKPTPSVKMLKDACTQTEVDHILYDEAENKARRKGDFDTAVPPALSACLRDQSSSNSLQSSGSKKRVKKKRSMPMVSPSPIPNFESHNDYIEIMDLEEMEDKATAFLLLTGIYKQQKYLRDAEHDLHRQKIADLTAGLVAQKMVNLKLIDALREKGSTSQEIQGWIGANLDATQLVADPSTDTLVSEDTPILDPSRFVMLRKEAQLGKMREFGSSQGDLLSPLLQTPMLRAPTEDTLDLTDSTSDLELLGCFPHRAISPVPSIPLPPLPSSRRAAKSMLLPIARPAVLSNTRSRSLTEVAFPTIASIDAFNIDEKMRRLELEFAFSRSAAGSASTVSVLASPKFQDKPLPTEETEAIQSHVEGNTGVNTPFEVIIQEVVDMRLDQDQDAGLLTSQASSDDGYQTGLHISSLGSSWATGESSSDSFAQSVSNRGHDADESLQDPFIAEPEVNHEAQNVLHSSVASLLEPRRYQRRPTSGRGGLTPHTFHSESGFTSRPGGLSIDDSIWANILMGLMRRTDARSRASSEVDLEKGLADGDNPFNEEVRPAQA